MSKPLELTIHPPIPPEPTDPQSWGGWFVGRVNEEADMARKRFSEAELCAEYWRHEGDYRMLSDGYRIESFSITDHGMPPWATETLECDRVNTLHRFATHPHYFEATEPESDTE